MRYPKSVRFIVLMTLAFIALVPVYGIGQHMTNPTLSDQSSPLSLVWNGYPSPHVIKPAEYIPAGDKLPFKGIGDGCARLHAKSAS